MTFCNIVFSATNNFLNAVKKFDLFINTYRGKKTYRIATILWIALLSVYLVHVQNTANPTSLSEMIITSLFFIILLFLIFAYDIYKFFISLRWFMSSQLFIICIIFTTLKSIISVKSRISNDAILISGISLVVCCLFSITANSTVSVTGNTIFAGLTSIILLIGNSLITMMPLNSSIPTCYGYYFGAKVTYTLQQKNQIDFNFATMPILIFSSLAAMLAALKSYWIKKHNNGEKCHGKTSQIKQNYSEVEESTPLF